MTTLRGRLASSAAIALLASTYAFVAVAGDKAAAAQALFEEARTLMANGQYAAACAKFEGSRTLDPGPGTDYNLALCYEKAGRTASAWATYLSAATAYRTTNRPDWEKRARDRAAALEPTLARLSIVVAPGVPASAEIARDGAPVLPSELGVAIPVDPGKHVVAARFRSTSADAPDWTTSVELASGAKETVTVPTPSVAPAIAPRLAPVEVTAPPATDGSRRTLAFVLGGVGIVGAGLGSVAGLIAMNENATSERDCPSDGICRSPAALDANDSASTWATISTVSFIAGGALLAGAVVLYLTSPKTSANARGAAMVAAKRGLALSW